jgi:hypothetical protein
VRHKVTELISLVTDNARMNDERAKAKANRDKYKGVSADDVANGNVTPGAKYAFFARLRDSLDY